MIENCPCNNVDEHIWKKNEVYDKLINEIKKNDKLISEIKKNDTWNEIKKCATW